MDSPSYRPTAWLRELARTPRAARFPWGLSIRLVVGLAIPFAVGLAIHAPLHILFCVLGVLLATSTQHPVAYRRSILQVALTAPVGIVAYGLGLVASQGIVWQAVVVTVVGIVCGLISATSGMASTLAMEAIIVVIIVANIPLASFQLAASAVFVLPLLFLAGVGLALVLLLIEAALFRARPERESVAVLAAALARYAQTLSTAPAPASGAVHTPDPPNHAEAVVAARQAVIEADGDAYRDLLADRLHSQGASRTNETRAAVLGATSAITRSLVSGTSSRAALATAASWLQAIAAQLRAGGDPLAPPVPIVPDGQSATDHQLLVRVRTLAVLLWPSSYADASPPRLLDGAAQRWLDQGPVIASLPARLRARATIGAAAWRDAVRIALCLLLAVIAGGILHEDHGFWIPLMVAIIMKPDFGSVFARSLQRIGGTVLGGLIGAAIALAVPATGPWMPLIILVLAFPMPWAAIRAYWLLSVFITPVVIVLVDWAIGSASPTLAWYRVFDTLIAAAIVLVFGYLIWPRSFRTELPVVFRSALARLGAYLSAAFAPGAETAASAKQLAVARDAAYRRLSDTQIQLQRTLAEPPPASRGAEAWYPAVATAQHLADLITAYAEDRHRAALAPGTAVFPVPSAEAVAARVTILSDLQTDADQHRGAPAEAATTAVPPDPTGALDRVDDELEHFVELVQGTRERAGRPAHDPSRA